MRNSVLVRKGSYKDLEILLTLASEFTVWFREIDPDAPATDKMKLARTLRNLAFCEQPHLFSLIAEQDQNPVGYALYSFGFWADTNDSVLFLSALFSKHSGQGIGAALLDELKAIAETRNCDRVMFNVWDLNTSAIAFYEHLGAQKILDEPIMYFQMT